MNRWTDQKKGVKTSTRSSVNRNGGEVIEKSINKEKPIGNYFIYPGEVLSIPPELKKGIIRTDRLYRKLWRYFITNCQGIRN